MTLGLLGKSVCSLGRFLSNLNIYQSE